MEFLGHGPTSCYTTATRRPEPVSKITCTTTLPTLGKQRSMSLADNCRSPFPQKRNLSTLGFRPATYYSANRLNPTYSLTKSTVASQDPCNDMSKLCGIKIPSVYSAARNALYTRYTPAEWYKSYQRLLHANDRGQKESTCLKYASDRLIDETAERTKENQNESSHRLGDRLADIVFWQSELSNEIDRMAKENNDLMRSKRVAEKLLDEVENQMHVAEECLYQREKRQCVDLVHDDVEKKLLSEVCMVKKAQEEIRNLIDKANVQYELNRAAQHQMEVDLKNKFAAQQVDETALGMKNGAAGVHYYEGVEHIEQCQSVPETWSSSVQDIVNRSRAERANSRKLREQIANKLAKLGQQLAEHWADVNAALAQRVREVTDVRNKIQASLGNTIQEIEDTEREIEKLKDAIRAKEAYLGTATSRLNLRFRRPGMEDVCDPANYQLKCEIIQLKNVIQDLRDQLCKAQDMLQELLRLRSAKEGELAVKNNSLFIDREKCLGLRSNWPGGPTAAAALAAPCPGGRTDASGTSDKTRSCGC